jgi:putative membrane protein
VDAGRIRDEEDVMLGRRAQTGLGLGLAAATVTAFSPLAERGPSDAEIAAIVMEANAIDAELGELAATRASNEAVRAFGRTMARDHRAVNEQVGALGAKLKITPVPGELSRKLRSDATAFRAELERLSGSAFDRTYIAHEVAYHQAVIDAVDSVLLPSAQNAELKGALAGVRPALVAHLRHAEQLHAAVK